MYRDLSAQLVAKEAELADAREQIAKLEAHVTALEAELAEIRASGGNRDAVLKNAVLHNDELTREKRRLDAEVAELQHEVRTLRKGSRTQPIDEALAGLANLLRTLIKK